MKRWLKRFVLFFLGLSLLLVCVIGPIDRTPIEEQDHYKKTLQILDTLPIDQYPAKEQLQASWGKISITPDHVMPMAGYRIRPRFDSIHDSLFARVIHIYNGKSVYFISLDLLIFPPAIEAKLSAQFSKQINPPVLYLGATHTHNGVGGWHNSLGGEVILGEYDSVWVNQVVERISHLIAQLSQDRKPAQIGYWQSAANDFVENRLATNASADGMLRGFQIIRNDSTKAKLVTFSAHPTTIKKSVLQLSGDYPAFLTKELENKHVFGVFMAGMVGSHRLSGLPESKEDFDQASRAGELLAEQVMSAEPMEMNNRVIVRSATLPIQFAPSQLRISRNLKIRNWIFSVTLNPLQGELKFLELGNMVFVGTPCDFSGELFVTQKIDKVAQGTGKKVIITSFNGNYVGYITEDKHYDIEKKEEVMALNWVGPYHGAFYAGLIKKLLQK